MLTVVCDAFTLLDSRPTYATVLLDGVGIIASDCLRRRRGHTVANIADFLVDLLCTTRAKLGDASPRPAQLVLPAYPDFEWRAIWEAVYPRNVPDLHLVLHTLTKDNIAQWRALFPPR